MSARLHLAVKPLDILLFLVVVAIWGLNFTVSKWGVSELPPMLFVSLRFAIVALLLLPIAARPQGKWRPLMAASVTMGLLHFACMFTAIKLVPASTASLIGQSQVPMAAALAAFFLKDPPGWRRLLGMALSILGVGVVMGEPRFTGPWWALALIVAAAFWWAVANVQIKSIGSLSGWTLNAWIAAFSAPQLLAASLILEEGQWAAIEAASWRAWGAVLYNSLAVVVLGYGIWYKLLKRYDVNQAMPFTLLVPPIAVLFAALLLGESLSWELLVGGMLTLVGVAIITLRRPRHVEGPERV